jgi:Protein of unknown function (DUF3429)
LSPARIALALGLLGLVPFAGFAIAAWLTPNIGLRFTFLQAEILWAAIILSFMAGARWAFTLTQPSPDPWRVLAFGLFPALALAAPFLPIGWAALLLASGFIGLLASELTSVARHEAPEWYTPLRIFLTLVALVCLSSVAFL